MVYTNIPKNYATKSDACSCPYCKTKFVKWDMGHGDFEWVSEASDETYRCDDAPVRDDCCIECVDDAMEYNDDLFDEWASLPQNRDNIYRRIFEDYFQVDTEIRDDADMSMVFDRFRKVVLDRMAECDEEMLDCQYSVIADNRYEMKCDLFEGVKSK